MRSRIPKGKANSIQIAGCYLYWWFSRRPSTGSDFDTQVKNYFAKSQFFTSVLLPLLLAVGWIEYKVFNIQPNSLPIILIVMTLIGVFVIDALILSHSKSLTRHFESMENRTKFDILVLSYLAFVLSLMVLTAFTFPHRAA
jgi:hypothetical protein